MKPLIISTIHGIHTTDMNTWQDNFRFYAKALFPEVKLINFEYGTVLAPFAWMNAITKCFHLPAWLTDHLIARYAKHLEELSKKFPDHEISILAHSLGTWIAYWALVRCKEVNIRNLVLVGAVISSHQEKLDIVNWLETGKMNALYNWYSHSDRVVEFAPPPFGKAGFRGMIRRGFEEDRTLPAFQPYPIYQIYNRAHEGHGGALSKLEQYGPALLGCLTKSQPTQ